MRKNHHGKKDRLVKRVFALCLALAVICTCLVPVFATEGLSDLQVEKELPGTSEEEAAGFGDDFPAVDDGEPREVYDEGEAAGFGEDEVATRPVEGGEDNLDGGPSVKETEWGTVIEYGPSSSTSTDPSSSTETQWSGEDDMVEKPDDKVVVSGDEIKKLQDMVVYRFWLKELNANDLQDITAQAQINNMTESEYLARNGEVLWNLYFIQAVPRVETIADYSSYIENPSSNRYEDAHAGAEAQTVVADLQQKVETPEPEAESGPLDPELPVVEVDGNEYVGEISIPAIGIDLPVMSEWSYPRLKIAPCRQFGSSRTDDLVIAAHNYESHFGKLTSLTAGDSVTFTDMDGIVNEYVVNKVEVLDPHSVEEVEHSGYALVLYTCTYGGKTRVTVFCDRAS